MSGIASFLMSLWEKSKNKTLESRAFFVIGSICLLVAFDQAWQDEHKNSQTLITEKLTLSEESGFWKEQSYQKDSAIQTRDQLLAQNYTALIAEQNTANGVQKSLTDLSTKILEVGQPPKREVTILPFTIEQTAPGFYERSWLFLVNKDINPIRLHVYCSSPITRGSVGIVGNLTSEANQIYTPDRQNSFGIALASTWNPKSPVFVTVDYTAGTPDCSFDY